MNFNSRKNHCVQIKWNFLFLLMDLEGLIEEIILLLLSTLFKNILYKRKICIINLKIITSQSFMNSQTRVISKIFVLYKPLKDTINALHSSWYKGPSKGVHRSKWFLYQTNIKYHNAHLSEGKFVYTHSETNTVEF